MASISERDVDQLVHALDAGRHAWIHGRPEMPAGGLVTQDDEQLILGPFGGEGIVGGTSIEPLQAAMSAQFHGGSGSCDVLKTIVADDLLVLVMIERSLVEFDGYETPQPWVLRVTQVFRRNERGWTRLLRHADPLAAFQPLADTLAMVQRRAPSRGVDD